MLNSSTGTPHIRGNFVGESSNHLLEVGRACNDSNFIDGREFLEHGALRKGIHTYPEIYYDDRSCYRDKYSAMATGLPPVGRCCIVD